MSQIISDVITQIPREEISTEHILNAVHTEVVALFDVLKE